MLRCVLTFLLIALVAGIFGPSDITSSAVGIAKVLFFVFLVLIILSLIFGKRIWKDTPRARSGRVLVGYGVPGWAILSTAR